MPFGPERGLALLLAVSIRELPGRKAADRMAARRKANATGVICAVCGLQCDGDQHRDDKLWRIGRGPHLRLRSPTPLPTTLLVAQAARIAATPAAAVLDRGLRRINPSAVNRTHDAFVRIDSQMEAIMKLPGFVLAVLVLSAGLALAAPPPPKGGPPGGGGSPGGRPPPGSPGAAPPAARPPGDRPPGAPPPSHDHHRGGGGGYWYGPSWSFYYGSPYWWGASGYYWPGYFRYSSYWPGYYGYGYYWPGYYGYGYVPPTYVYGPPGVVTSTADVVYIERESGTVSTQQAAPDAATPPTPPPPGTQWWYLCASPRGAYPYVRECPGGWERVPAVPPGPVK